MSNYEKQNFEPGQVLTAAQLNHMENEIFQLGIPFEEIATKELTSPSNFIFLNADNDNKPFELEEAMILVNIPYDANLTSEAKLELQLRISTGPTMAQWAFTMEPNHQYGGYVHAFATKIHNMTEYRAVLFYADDGSSQFKGFPPSFNSSEKVAQALIAIKDGATLPAGTKATLYGIRA